MDQHHKQLRRAAAAAFFESLDKLQETLCVDGQPAQAAPEVDSHNSLTSLEQAVADIEQFMQSKDEH